MRQTQSVQPKKTSRIVIYRSRLANFLLLGRCLVYFLLHGKADKKLDTPRKALVALPAALGDTVCVTPIFRAIKNKYPDCFVYAFGDRKSQEVIRGNRDYDEYILLDGSVAKNIKALRSKGIDFACVPCPNFSTAATLFLSGVPLIAITTIVNGFCPAEILPYRILKSFLAVAKHRMKSYAPREYLRLLEFIGIFTDDATKHLAFAPESDSKITELLASEKISSSDLTIIISPSAGNKTKQWDAKNFARVADYLYTKYKAKIILIGAKNDETEIRAMIDHLAKETKVINTLNLLSIDETKALFARAKLFVSVDTGPVYYAEAFDVPNVNITGPVDEKEQPPISAIHRVVFADVACRPCSFVANGAYYCRNVETPFVCLTRITPEIVCREIDELLASLGKRT